MENPVTGTKSAAKLHLHSVQMLVIKYGINTSNICCQKYNDPDTHAQNGFAFMSVLW